MNYPTFDVNALATFTGRPVASFTAYATEALEQATLFFKKATCLAGFPDAPDDALLASKAILQLADYFVLSQPFQAVLASPFSSESIGSYSYSKMVSSINRREQTNLLWFDMAVEDLGQCGTMGGLQAMGGIEVFEFDNIRVDGQNGNSRLTGPTEEFLWTSPDPSSTPVITSDGIFDGGTP